MKNDMSRIVMTMAAGVLATLGMSAALSALAAQPGSYPTKPVRIVVGFAPGGANDVIARLAAEELGEIWKQSVIVDNRPGAAGVIGTQMVAKASADGYTLLLSSQTSMAVAPNLYRDIPYDTIRDFAAITIPAWGPALLVVNPNLPVRSVPELIALAKSKPGQLAYGSGGIGSTPHMTAELFNTLYGIKTTHVPYKGESPALIDLVSNQVQFMFPSLPSALQYVRSGRLRALGVTSLKRFAGAQEFPPLAEVGAPGFEANGWYGLFAPAGTPAAVVERIYNDLTKTLGGPEGRKKLLVQGREFGGQTPAAFTASLKAEIARWGQVVKTQNIHAD